MKFLSLILLLSIRITWPQSSNSLFYCFGACWVWLCCNNPPNSDMDYIIFDVRTDVNASDCTWGCTDTDREPALKVDCTGELNLHQRCDGPMLYQLSYIPSHSLVSSNCWMKQVLERLIPFVHCSSVDRDCFKSAVCIVAVQAYPELAPSNGLHCCSIFGRRTLCHRSHWMTVIIFSSSIF